MTSQAPTSTRLGRRQGPRGDVAERDTRLLRPEHHAGVDPYGLLDHRTRERALLEDVAPPGRYLAVEHDGRSWLIALSRPITHIGRGLVADVRLEDPHVSRRHAIVAIRGDGPDAVRVLDDRSSGGTFVNGSPVTVAQLRDGDIVGVGRVAFRYTEIAPQVRRRRMPRRIPLSTVRRPRSVRPAAA
jgi:FHA domain